MSCQISNLPANKKYITLAGVIESISAIAKPLRPFAVVNNNADIAGAASSTLLVIDLGA